jgi:hypothetical protein
MRGCWSVLVAACRIHFDPVPASSDDASAGRDAGDGSAPLGPWSPPTPIPTAATAGEEQDVTGLSGQGKYELSVEACIK